MKTYFDNVIVNIVDGYESLNKENYIEEENLFVNVTETDFEKCLENEIDDCDIYKVSIYDNIFEYDTHDNWMKDVPFKSILSIIHSCYLTKRDWRKYQDMKISKERIRKELDLIPQIYKNLV